MYTIQKAKTMLAQLIEEAARGNEVIIARDNVPVARIVPIKLGKPRKPGSLKGRLKAKPGAFDPLTPKELAALGIQLMLQTDTV